MPLVKVQYQMHKINRTMCKEADLWNFHSISAWMFEREFGKLIYCDNLYERKRSHWSFDKMSI